MIAIQASPIEAGTSTSDLISALAMDFASDIGDADWTSYTELVMRTIDTSSAPEGGRLAFNLAGLHRLRREFDLALDLLEVAAERQPRYCRRRLKTGP